MMMIHDGDHPKVAGKNVAFEGLGFKLHMKEMFRVKDYGGGFYFCFCYSTYVFVLFPPTHEPNLYLKYIMDVFEYFMLSNI